MSKIASERILITGARAPAALHLSRILHHAGHEVILADSQYFPLARSTRFKQKYIRVPSPVADIRRYGAAIETVVHNEGCALVIPTCEEIFHLAAWRDLHGGTLPLLAPSFDLLQSVHNKYDITHISADCGADAVTTRLLTNRSDLEQVMDQAAHLVFKPVWSRFASRILICPSQKKLAQLQPSSHDPWIAQDYLPGEELCCWAMLHNGQVTALSSYKPLYRVNHGAAIAFAQIHDPTISSFVRAFGLKTNWTGLVAFDFRRDNNGLLHVIECNPRATSGINLFGPNTNLAAAVLGRGLAEPDQKRPMSLPLAMLAYGLPNVLRRQGISGIRQWWNDARSMADISFWPGDRTALPMQLLSLCEFAVYGLQQGRSVSAASTSDIEWNGSQGTQQNNT